MPNLRGNPEEMLPRVVCRIRNETTGVTGSGCATGDRRVLTCHHVITGAERLTVSWSALAEEHEATVEFANPKTDLAILRLESPTQAMISTIVPSVTDREFVTFGFRHSRDFDGLFASGQVLGEVRRTGAISQRLLQLRSSSLDQGMSGAPIFFREEGEWRVAGLVAGVWSTAGVRDGDLAFAVPGEFLLDATLSVPRRAEARDQDRLLAWAARYLVEDRFEDGAWGKSFRPPEGKFSSDARVHASRSGKRALSVTGWAAIALLRASGGDGRAYAAESKSFVMKTYLPTIGAFGHVYRVRSATPLVKPTTTEMPNPRHTASTISYLLEVEGPSRVVARGLSYLVACAHPEGGWGEGDREGCNTLATAYIVDALTKCLEQWPALTSYLEPQEAEDLRGRTRQVRKDALDWLVRRQRPDGTWLYRGDTQYDSSAPAYTAHVVAFAPEIIGWAPNVDDRLCAFLAEQIDLAGGVPLEFGGHDIAVPSLMLSYGLRRSGRDQVHDFAEQLAKGGAQALDTAEPSQVKTLSYTFYLLYQAACGHTEPGSPGAMLVTRVLNGLGIEEPWR